MLCPGAWAHPGTGGVFEGLGAGELQDRAWALERKRPKSGTHKKAGEVLLWSREGDLRGIVNLLELSAFLGDSRFLHGFYLLFIRSPNN